MVERDLLWQELSDLKTTLQRLEAKVEARFEAVAPRDWVHTLMQPMQQAVTRMEAAVASLSEESKSLFEAHNTLLKEKAIQEREQWSEKTAMGLVKKYAPVVAFIIAMFTLFRVLGTYIEVYVKHVAGQ